MDEYRTTLSHSFEPMYSKIDQLEEKLVELSKQKKRRKKNQNEKIKKAFNKIDSIKMAVIDEEITNIQIEKEWLRAVNQKMNNYKRYDSILSIIQKRSQ